MGMPKHIVPKHETLTPLDVFTALRLLGMRPANPALRRETRESTSVSPGSITPDSLVSNRRRLVKPCRFLAFFDDLANTRGCRTG